MDQLLPAPPRGADLAARLEEDGYLLLPGSDALVQELAGLWQAGEAFFALPAARKQANTLPEDDGYHASGREYSARPDRPDLAESFWARLIHAGATARLTDPEARTLHRAALAACAEFERLLSPLTEALARHYARPWAPEHAFACDRASHLQLNRYEPARQSRDLLTDAHEDGLYLTLLHGDAPGLEVQSPDGGWRPVQTRPGELLVMPGEIFSLLCGYRVRPLYHRVRNHPEVRRRTSVMYFANPNPRHGFRPWIASPTNAGVDIIERAVRNPTRYGLPPIPVASSAVSQSLNTASLGSASLPASATST